MSVTLCSMFRGGFYKSMLGKALPYPEAGQLKNLTDLFTRFDQKQTSVSTVSRYTSHIKLLINWMNNDDQTSNSLSPAKLQMADDVGFLASFVYILSLSPDIIL